MAWIILGFSILAASVIATAAKSAAGNSSIYFIDAGWVDSAERFRLVSRWGLK